MKSKQYRLYKLIISFLLAGLIGSFVVAGNFIIPLIALSVTVILMFILKKNVDESISDERIEYISGKSSRIVFAITTSSMAVTGLILISLRNIYPQYYLIGNILAYITCGIMFIYTIVFKYYSSKI